MRVIIVIFPKPKSPTCLTALPLIPGITFPIAAHRGYKEISRSVQIDLIGFWISVETTVKREAINESRSAGGDAVEIRIAAL